MSHQIVETRNLPVMINEGTSRKFGEDIAKCIWKSRGEINNRDILIHYTTTSVHFRKYSPVFFLDLYQLYLKNGWKLRIGKTNQQRMMFP